MNEYAPLLLGLESLFPVCRSELLDDAGDPKAFRTLIDRNTSVNRFSPDLYAQLTKLGMAASSEGCQTFLNLAGLASDPPSTDEVLSRLHQAISDLAGDQVAKLATAGLNRTPVLTQLDRAFLQLPRWSSDDIREKGTVIGRNLERELFLIAAGRLGHPSFLAIELDSASRLLSWFERYAGRDKRRDPNSLGEAIAIGWDIVAGVDRKREAGPIDRRLQAQFVDTDRNPGDWVMWMASSAVDAVYAAMGVAFDRPTEPLAVEVARSAAENLACFARGLDPWDATAVHATLVDPAVIDELGAQLRALSVATTEPLLLRPT